MILGLTGGMGCGKSAAANLFAQQGFEVMDSDAVVRTSILTDPAVIDSVREHFGDGILASGGAIDRRKLAERVFADKPSLEWLEGVVHPRLFEHWRRTFSAQTGQSWVVEVPLLFEKSLQNWFDFTICVACDPTVQLARLEQRGVSPSLARLRIAQQLPLTQKIKLADFVLLNDGSFDFLRQQVEALVKSIRSL